MSEEHEFVFRAEYVRLEGDFLGIEDNYRPSIVRDERGFRFRVQVEMGAISGEYDVTVEEDLVRLILQNEEKASSVLNQIRRSLGRSPSRFPSKEEFALLVRRGIINGT